VISGSFVFAVPVRAAERAVALITRYADRFDPVDRITFYSGIVRGLAPIRAELQAQMRAHDIPKD
jgi:hypothetical protein